MNWQRRGGIQWTDASVPPTSKTQTRWECHQGHQWVATYTSMRLSQNCPVCAQLEYYEARRKKPADYEQLGKDRNFEWLGPQVSNTNTKTRWRCSQGHQWMASYSNIRSGKGCPACAGRLPKQALDYQNLAKSQNLEWLGPLPQNTSTKTKWRCAQRHEWETIYSSIQQGSGCPVCANCVPKTTADYHALAQQHHIAWIGSQVPRRVALKTSWRCPQGHEWNACYNHIQQGSSCPFCAGVAKKDAAAYLHLAEKKGIEWTGELPQTTTYKTTWRCPAGHEWEASYASVKYHACPICAGTSPRTADDYDQLARSRQFEWIENRLPPNTTTKTLWRCQDGHEWWAAYHKIKLGRGCPVCARLSRRKRNFQQFSPAGSQGVDDRAANSRSGTTA